LEETMKLLSVTWLPLCVVALSAPVFAGCSAEVEARGPEVEVAEAPPAERVEVAPAPRVGYVWVRGHWQWAGRQYVWAPGHWEAVRAGHRWEEGHWARRPRGWVWVEGHWVR
jgi:WXXGXW repeat (2 copies)